MSTNPVTQGTVGDNPNGPELRIERRFQHPIDGVWAAMTESDWLELWIGRWEGDPATGRVTFWMTAEVVWHLRFQLSPQEGFTTVIFAQVIGQDSLASVGPGWEYYLDRLSSVLEGKDAAAVDWNDYYPAMREYYESLSH